MTWSVVFLYAKENYTEYPIITAKLCMYYERKIDFLSFDTRETQRPCKYVVKRQKMTSYATATLAKEAHS